MTDGHNYGLIQTTLNDLTLTNLNQVLKQNQVFLVFQQEANNTGVSRE